jgi:DNA-binding MarR family transcriptional regulator
MRTLDDSLGFQVNRLAAAMRAAFEARLAPYELTAPQWATMMRLLERDGRPQKELGDCQSMDKATVGGIIARLEAKSLIAREVDPDDGRANRVTLTAAGRELAQRLEPFAEEVNGRATASLTLEETKQLHSLLIRARSSLKG